jgi:hypothetical protein
MEMEYAPILDRVRKKRFSAPTWSTRVRLARRTTTKQEAIPAIIAVRLSCKAAMTNVPQSRPALPPPPRLPGSIPIAYPSALDAVVRSAPTAAGLESDRNADRLGTLDSATGSESTVAVSYAGNLAAAETGGMTT